MNRPIPPPPPIPPGDKPFRETSVEIVDITPGGEKTGATAGSVRRTVGAFGIGISFLLAMGADALDFTNFPALYVFSDAAMALALLLIWGFRREMLLIIIPELIPVVSMFPTWTLFVAFLAGGQMTKKK